VNEHEHEEPDRSLVIRESLPGWHRIRLHPFSSPIFVEARLGEHGKAVITTLVVRNDDGISAADLRRLPMRRLEAALSDSDGLAWLSRKRKPSPIRILEDAARSAPARRGEPRIGRARLSRPDGRDPEDFYRLVAEAYRDYVQRTHKPARQIADEAGVPIATARRWINHARELGLLEKGQRGRAV